MDKTYQISIKSTAYYFWVPLLKRLFTISSLASRKFYTWHGIKFNNFGCALYLIFLFLEAFLSTSLEILTLDLFYRYFNVSFIKKSLSPFYNSC